MGMEEAELSRAMEQGLTDELTSPTRLHLACHSHSIVLACMEVTNRMDDMPGKMVRMGNLHESGRVSRDHLESIERVVAERFRFYAVKELPSEFTEWQRKSKHVLVLTRAALDLTPEKELYITDMDNGD